MVLFINTRAAAGSALEKWKKIEAEFSRRYTPIKVCPTGDMSVMSNIVRRFFLDGEKDFVAAGGDGTVNALLNSILTVSTTADLQRVRIGAIGLGSSNDFHKPFLKEQLVQNVPCKLDFQNSYLRDVGCLTYESCGKMERRYFLANASLGVTAEANRFFNDSSSTILLLKRFSVNAAIFYAAIRTILLYRNFRSTIQVGGDEQFATDLTNLAVMKNPHVSGRFLYDTPVSYQSGLLAINLSEGMSKINLLQLLYSLSQGKFSTLDHTRSWNNESVTVSSPESFAIEYDGEVTTSTSVTFSVLRKHIRVCP